MALPVDLEEGEVIINKHVLFSESLLERSQAEANKTAGGNLSLYLRRVLRKHFNIKEKN